ncbi:MAG TPA: Gfo/Idh/MocA family oxidoreductase [Thermoguttaceae bacterium]|nr:Gfo/Idh/MocA family oxidoreductase [Thermoguttaceae bacterium]
MNRRRFLKRSGAATALSLAGVMAGRSRARGQGGANDRISVAAAGLRGRGGGLLQTFASLAEVEVTYVCDLDERVLGERAKWVEEKTGRRPKAIKDFREALDDPSLDALVLGTPDHWHAIPAIMACQAGKDVYVEKPDGHNVLEGRTMVAAARKYQRIVQLGTQARSEPQMHKAMEYIASGKLGRVRFAKAWESSRQGSIGHPPDGDPPAGVDYDLWLGPAPLRPFNPRRFHGSWRWFFDYGTGDLGNDGVHRLDKARWGLATALAAEGKSLSTTPAAVSAHGGKHYFDDDQEWPDNLMVTYDFGQSVLTYEMRIWSPYPLDGEREGAAVLGDDGYMVIGNRRWRALDAKGKQVAEEEGGDATAAHVENFLASMRTREKPAADLETVGHPSSLLCHLGNAAWRAGRSLRFDPQTYTFRGDEEASQYLTRPEYRKPWVLPKIAEL